MSAAKRSSKTVSYNEQDDDDDFLPIGGSSKKDRPKKLKELSTSTKKREKKSEQDEPKQPAKPVLIENENSSSQSLASNDEENRSETIEFYPTNEPSSPSNKRMKCELDDVVESVPDVPSETPTIPLTRLVEMPRRNSSVPFGFPTSKINIPSPHVSRVGLSRKSLPAKPLHPNLTARVAPE